MSDCLFIPFRFIDSLEHKQHILLFYEEPEYARLMEFRFIKNGLQRGERCIYATEEDSAFIVLKLLSYGIPLYYFQTGKLRVIQIRNECQGREQMLKKCKKDMDAILYGLVPPYRIVSRIVPDVNTIEGMSVELELEKETQNCFESLGGSLMCPYNISKIESQKRSRWLEELRGSHHITIYLPAEGHGGVYCQS